MFLFYFQETTKEGGDTQGTEKKFKSNQQGFF